MKKKIKIKSRKVNKKHKSKKKVKRNTFKKRIIKKIKISKKKHKVKKVRKIKKKRSLKNKIKLPKIQLKTSKFNFFKKISLESVIGFVLNPVFLAYEKFREIEKLNKIKKIALEKQENERQKKEQQRLMYEDKQKELRDEIKLQMEREKELKSFLKKEQKLIRIQQSEKRKRFLEEIKLNKKIESFRVRESKEIEQLERLALREQIADYKSGVEDRIIKIKQKYAQIREQKIKKRIAELGIQVDDQDTKEDLLRKEKEYQEQREKIELVLESFYRSANSLVFALNKFIPKHKSILRCINRLYETSECFIKYDDSMDDDYLILVYLEDNDSKKGKIIVENKSNPEKYETKTIEMKDIFAYSDYLVDYLCLHIDREREKVKKAS